MNFNKSLKEKYIYIFSSIIIFLIGNRIGLYAQYLKTQGYDSLVVITKLFNPFASFEVLGLKVGLDSISVLSGMIAILITVIAYIFIKSNKRNYRPGEEYGSARYGNLQTEASTLRDEDDDINMLISQNVHISMNTRDTFLNNNVCVIGGSGSGKTMFYVKPNILQMSCNYVITDPKLSLLPQTGNAFLRKGYDIKVLDLINLYKSMHYNPFKYLHTPLDVYKFINNLIENTSDKKQNTGADPFFEKAETAFLTALAFFVMACGDDDERNINTVMDLYFMAKASEDDEEMMSPLDFMFEDLKEENGAKIEILGYKEFMKTSAFSYLACLQYDIYKNAAGKTAKSILVSLGVRLYPFTLPEISELLNDDTIDLTTIGNPRKDKDGNFIKTVLFIGISDSDKSLNFIAAIMYQQLFDLLYRQADNNEDSCLPIHVRFLLDEFANIGKIPDFPVKIATIRSREISVNIILQNLGQLKTLYPHDAWETVFGNCDTTLFLGGKEYSSTDYLSKMIGNGTFDYRNVSETRGSHASTSISNQLVNRLLLDAAEISRIKRDECLIHVRGMQIFRDKKYDVFSHKNINLTVHAKDKQVAKNNLFDNEQLNELLKGNIENLQKQNINEDYINVEEKKSFISSLKSVKTFICH